MMINKRLIETVSESKRYIAGNVLMQWISLLGNLVMMTTIANLLEGLYQGNANRQALVGVVSILAAVLAVRYLCAIASSKMSYLSSKAVKRTLREQIYQKMLRLGAGYHQRVQTSEVVQVAVEGVEQLETYFGAYLPQFFYAMLAPLTLFVYLSFVNPSICGCTADLCAADSGGDCCCSDLGKKTAGTILGAVHRNGRYLFGKPAGLDHPENLSGGWF